MVFVWIQQAPGVKRFVDDEMINPCNLCGERISVCQAQNCIDKPVTTTTTITRVKKSDEHRPTDPV